MAVPVLFFATLLLCFVIVFQERTALGQLSPSPPPPPPSSRQRLTSGVELAALYDLRSSLQLQSRFWPRKVDPCTGWTGVECEAGRVVALELAGLRRTRIGRRSPQFAVDGVRNLSRLAVFNASGFTLRGPIPDWFGSHLPASLAVMDLRHCSVSGLIPHSLGNASGLSSLYLSGNFLTGPIPSTLGDLTNLTVLELSGNALAGSITASLGSLHRLASLDLSSNFLAGPIPPDIGKLSSLMILRASNNSLSGSIPEDLKNLRSLRQLDLGKNSLSGDLPENLFLSLRQLQSLSLSHNNFSGSLPSSLWALSDLRLLDASYNDFSGRLPDSAAEINFTAGSSFLDISHNSFFGDVPVGHESILQRFGFADISDNYFQGPAPHGINASFELNCFSDASNQRNSTSCAAFYAERGLAYGKASRRSSWRLKYTLAATLGGAAVLAILILAAFCCLMKIRAATADQQKISDDAFSGAGPLPPETSGNFTCEQLLRATSNFSESNLVKRGHSGDLYRGTLEGGTLAIIKRIDQKIAKKDAHLIELDFFSKASHARLVPFLGSCLEKDDEKFLVYKFTPNGDLSSSLHRNTATAEEGLTSLDWITRLKIAIGIAEALCYLHHECAPPFIHREIRATSVLLDDQFEVRLGSLSEVCRLDGDASPNIFARLLRKTSTDQGASGSTPATCAHDVYCMGKVLLELVTGELEVVGDGGGAAGERLEMTLSCISMHERDLVMKIVDPSLIVDDDLLDEVWATAVIAKSCLNPRPSRRPLAKHVLRALENPLKVVREDNGGSSRRSWNATTVFGSWRRSSSELASAAASARELPPAAVGKPPDFSAMVLAGDREKMTEADAEGQV